MSQYDPTFREKATDYLRGLLFSDDREGQRKAERLSNVLETVTPYGVATGVDDAAGAFGQGDMMTGGLMLGMAGLPGPSPKGIRAFHGSPHSFDKFSMDKIGTGEGAQAYGHGLYFADSEGVARSYRDALSTPKGDQSIADDAMQLFGSKDDAIAYLEKTASELGGKPVMQRSYANAIEILRGGKPSGSMYEVNINADPESFLDWDAPLSAQPSVQERLSRIGEASKSSTTTGMEKITRMQDLMDRAEVTEKLREAGIPGIKYLDAGSRGNVDVNDLRGTVSMFETAARKHPNDTFIASQLADAKQKLAIAEKGGSRNYVVFDDKLISIVRKYGIAGASAMLGYNILDGVSESQAAQLKQAEAK
jgi:hypothetical protein